MKIGVATERISLHLESVIGHSLVTRFCLTRQQTVTEMLETLEFFKGQVLHLQKKEGPAVVKLAAQVVEDHLMEFKVFSVLGCILTWYGE